MEELTMVDDEGYKPPSFNPGKKVSNYAICDKKTSLKKEDALGNYS